MTTQKMNYRQAKAYQAAKALTRYEEIELWGYQGKGQVYLYSRKGGVALTPLKGVAKLIKEIDC